MIPIKCTVQQKLEFMEKLVEYTNFIIAGNQEGNPNRQVHLDAASECLVEMRNMLDAEQE